LAQILIRGLTDDEVARLRRHARQHDRSLEAEARLALRQAATRPTLEELQHFATWAGQMRTKLAGKVKGNSADILRTAREARARQLDVHGAGSPRKTAAKAR
jgi:plasmid stability protein